jgi:hypothetical protein
VLLEASSCQACGALLKGIRVATELRHIQTGRHDPFSIARTPAFRTPFRTFAKSIHGCGTSKPLMQRAWCVLLAIRLCLAPAFVTQLNTPHTARQDRSKTTAACATVIAGGADALRTFSFGSIGIDGTTYEHDVIIDRGQVSKRKKKLSKKFRDTFGHTPLSVEETIPWRCQRLVIGTGTGALPVMEEVKQEAKRRKVELLVLPTARAIEALKENLDDTNAILHITC